MSPIAVAPEHLTEAENKYTLSQNKVLGHNRTNSLCLIFHFSLYFFIFLGISLFLFQLFNFILYWKM